MEDNYFEPEEIRSIIFNAHKIKEFNKCPLCDGIGWENWDEDGGDIKAGRTNDPDREEGQCENCNGIGYVDLLMYK
ncbi:MAG: hypothetical protein RLZZ86_199 [Cyanobacteriota bacterium]|jgi:hypothetical protein